MTNRSNWDEDKLEEKLQQLPPIKDRQSKEELFQVIQKKMNERQIDKTDPVVIKKKRPWLYPAIATAAAVFLIMLILPSLIDNNDHFSRGDMDKADMERSGVAEDTDSGDAGIMMDFDDEAGEKELGGEMGIASAPEEEAMESDQLVNYVIVPLPYAMQVPVILDSELGEDERVTLIGKHLELEGELDRESMIYLALTSEEAHWGTDLRSQLQDVAFNENENSITLDFYGGHRMESLSSTQENIFSRAIHEYFSFLGIELVKFTVDGDSGIMYGQTGERHHEWGINTDNRGYYVYTDETGTDFLIRAVVAGENMYENGELLSLSDTLDKMKYVSEDGWYEPVVPEDVQFSNVAIEGNHAIITLSEDSEINRSDFDLFAEAVALTAADFDIDFISFVGRSIDEISEFRETEMISTTNLVPNIR
ncbi:hypothetical protein J2S74_003518 [Evansella vedderi]|uniref:Uncharacterized protein n=1 Tax=Evansella vedderi TaxID=38282 RepID=A0ABT9ZZ47_9BACI|nr:hypothetical protein [Evansella vedderi]MDQ0256119.1 hypothetical protein [Evansella vedderi]